MSTEEHVSSTEESVIVTQVCTARYYSQHVVISILPFNLHNSLLKVISAPSLQKLSFRKQHCLGDTKCRCKIGSSIYCTTQGI